MPATGQFDGISISHADLGPNYADPEILQEHDLIVFQTGPDVWLGTLDPITGLFTQADGRNWAVASDAISLTIAKNGPEFGIDHQGWAVFYNTITPSPTGERVRINRATPSGPVGSPFLVETITDVTRDRINQLASQNVEADATYVIFGRSTPDESELDIAWLCDTQPETDRFITGLTSTTAGFRWMDNTSFLTSTVSEPGAFGQIVLVNAATGEREIITADPDVKFDPYGWVAPEFGGTRMVIASIDERDIAVYRETEPVWQRIALLTPPTESGMSFVQSAEPFVVDGRSLIVLTLKNARGSVFDGSVTESQIWLYGIDDDPANRFALRVDDPDSPHPVRHEGEAYLGNDELMIYYNDVRPSGLGMRVSRTGISVNTPCPADTNNDGLVTPADFNAWIIAFNAAAPECDQNADALCTPADLNAWILNFNTGCG